MTDDPEGSLDDIMATRAAGRPARIVTSREEYEAESLVVQRPHGFEEALQALRDDPPSSSDDGSIWLVRSSAAGSGVVITDQTLRAGFVVEAPSVEAVR